jgi:multiple sugar transport system substrate-binding protein
MAKQVRLLVLITLTLALLTGTFADTRAQGKEVSFFSTQFNVVEEKDKVNTILKDFQGGTVKFVGSEEGPMIDLLKAESKAGKGANDVIGALHGTFPTLATEDLLLDVNDLVAEINKQTPINETYVKLGKLGTTDTQYYVPWMQATYVMAASKDALQYLPAGADINKLTWKDVAAWAKNMFDKTGKARLGFPVKGLFNRFLQGYAFPSFTGGMVTKFKSKEAAEMLRFLRDDLWPYVNPESINYDFMNGPLLSGEVLVAWDHTARLKPAFDKEPDKFVAFPSPAGPAGRGYMPVIAGMAIPLTAPNPDSAKELVRFMLSPKTQGAVLRDLGFFPVIDGVDTKDLPKGVGIVAAAVDAQAKSTDAIPSLLPVGLGARGGEINQIFRNAFNRVVVEKQDIEKVLTEEAAALQKLMTETGAPCWLPDAASKGPCQVE